MSTSAGCPALGEDESRCTSACSVQQRVCRTTRLLLMKEAFQIYTPTREQRSEKQMCFCSLDEHAITVLEQSSTGLSFNSRLLQI